MLNLALVGLLTGSLVTGLPDGGDRDRDRSPATPAAEQTDVPQVRLGLAPTPDPLLEAAGPRSIIADTYALGRAADSAPIKIWAEFGYGEVEGIYDRQGNESNGFIIGEGSALETPGEIIAKRISVGAQVNLLNFPMFKFGVGAVLNIAQNEFNADNAGDPLGAGLESEFGLQNVKVFGLLRGRVIGIHGGYIFDLAADQTFGPGPTPTNLTTTDGRNAINIGADFDYPSERFRLFGGIDYFMLENGDPAVGVVPGFPGSTYPDGEFDHDDILHFTMGAGLRFSIFELGAALHIRTQYKTGPDSPTALLGGNVVRITSGGHIGSVSPYLRVSPGFIPASLYIRGGVLSEYDEYGYPIGGHNDLKPGLGFTAGLSVGFN